jgi:thioredoxin-related protein
MNKVASLFLFGFVLSLTVTAQPTQPEKVKLYNPAADAKADIQAAIAQADKEGKNVLLQIGGNWCSWCYKFNDKVTGNDTLKLPLKKISCPII